ncbi:hypothetical protein TYRP_014429 [Tyrophagus putrescentiae]|nr:hypothetical protein TYRP_014429 [Tyrophagus putrescentiae]
MLQKTEKASVGEPRTAHISSDSLLIMCWSGFAFFTSSSRRAWFSVLKSGNTGNAPGALDSIFSSWALGSTISRNAPFTFGPNLAFITIFSSWSDWTLRAYISL